MARRPKAITITPKLIEFEDHIIRVPNIASVTIGPDPMRRFWALVLMGLALMFFLSGWLASQLAEVMTPPRGYGAAPPSPGMGAAGLLFALAAGCFVPALLLFKRKALFISKADSRFTLIVDKNPEFMREVMARIREALLAGEASSIVYQVNVTAERIERIDASTNSVEVVNSPGSNVVAGDAIGSDMSAIALPPPQPAMRIEPAVPPVDQMFDTVLARAGTVAPSLESLLRSAREPAALHNPQQPPPMPFGHDQKPPLSELSPERTSRTLHVAQSPGAITVGGNVHTAAFQTHVVATPVGDLDQLMSLLVERNVANHQQLNSYLAAVRDHLAGGPTSREHAAGYWRWFAEYAVATLSGVEGIMALVERIGTVFR